MKSPWVPFDYYLAGGIGGQFAFIAEPNWLAIRQPDQPHRHRPLRLPGVGPERPLHRHQEPELLAAAVCPTWTASPTSPSPTPTSSSASLNSGAMDIIHTDTSVDHSQLRDDTSLAYIDDSTPCRRRAGHGLRLLNLSKPPFNNLKVRQAMAMPSARQQYVQGHRQRGATTRRNGVFTTGSPYYLTNNGYPEPNLAKAKQLVTEVKESGGSGRLHPRPHPRPQGPARSAEFLQQQLQSGRHAGHPGRRSSRTRSSTSP